MPLSVVEVSPVSIVTLPKVCIANLIVLCESRLKDLPEGQYEVQQTYEVALKELKKGLEAPGR